MLKNGSSPLLRERKIDSKVARYLILWHQNGCSKGRLIVLCQRYFFSSSTLLPYEGSSFNSAFI
jgi:hypothetical protein